jgi:hypothetical protein
VRVCFLRPGSAPVEHAAALERAGAEVVVASEAPPGRFDVAIACSWRSASAAFAADAARHAFLVQRLEHRALLPQRPERLAAVAALDLPWHLLVTSRWLDAAVAEQHPHARRRLVRPGRPQVSAAPPADGPLRIAGAPPEVLDAMQEPHVAAPGDVLVALDTPFAEDLAAPAPAASPLAPILEAFASGATCVAVPTEGRDELVAHRETGLIVEPDDLAGTAGALDTLARDRELLARLRAGADAAARAWPSWDDAGAALRGALAEILDAPAPDDPSWPARLMADVTAEAAKLSAYESARSDEMHAWARRIEERERALAERPPGVVERVRGRLSS